MNHSLPYYMNFQQYPIVSFKKLFFRWQRQVSALFLAILCTVVSVHIGFGQITNPSNCGLGIAIPDSSCNATNQFRILVNNAPGSQLGTDVYLEEIRLIVAHTWVSDLDITLIAPSGVRVELSTDNGADEDNYGDPSDASCDGYISFNLSACNSVAIDTIPPFVGSYQPEGNLLDFNNGSNPNGQWILELCDDAGDDTGTLEFVELVFSPVVCFAPTSVLVENLDSTTVVLNWTPGESCTSTVIEYGLPGFSPGTGAQAGNGGTIVRVGCPPYQLEGLQERTIYEIYIREQCSADNFSTNSCPITIRTQCLPPPITMIETFDTQTECANICGQLCDIEGVWSNQENANFDWIIESGKTASIGTGPSDDVGGGGKYVYIETSGSLCRNGRSASLVSRCIEIDTTGSDSCHFSFNYHLFGSTIGSLELEISVDGGGSWQPIWSKSGNLGDRWYKQYINLSPWHSQIVQFRFLGKGGTSATGDIAIDHLVFYGSKDLGEPSYEFFADVDGDGFGNMNSSIKSCDPSVPQGYVENSADCNDQNANINPNASEIPCNQIDENCNGNLDDRVLTAPTTKDTTVCEQQIATVFAKAPPEGFILWYASPTGIDLLEFDEGAGYSVLATDTLTVYAEAWFGFECKSSERTAATIFVQSNPNLIAVATPPVCEGASIDLRNLTVIDQANTNSTLTYHTARPTTPENQLNSLIVTPSQTTTYYVAAQTNSGCKDDLSINISINPTPQVQISGIDTISVCAEGEITLAAASNDTTLSYNYLWSTGEVGNTIKVKSSNIAGSVNAYTLTITDENGCKEEDTAWVKASNGIGSARVATTEVSNCGGKNGALFVEPLSGTPPFNYYWSGTQNGSAENQPSAYQINNLAQGIYRVTVTDSSPLACEIQLPFTLVNGPSARVAVTSNEAVRCPDGDDGKICLDVRGVNPVINWSNGANTPCIEGLKSGKYSVTITDGLCETILTDLEVVEPAPIQMAANITSPTCAESTDGEIALSIAGGTAPYTLFWQDGNNFENRQNLSSGIYPLEILDVQNCIYRDTIELIAPDTLKVLQGIVEDPTCFELNNGKISPNVEGGTAPYFFAWSNGIFNNTLNELSSGSYQLTVTDVNQCIRTATFQLRQPTRLELELDSLENASCSGVADGAIQVRAKGGTPNYFFQWSDNQSDATRNNLAAGNYLVTVFDANACKASDSFTILAPPTIKVTSNVTAPACMGSKDGILDITVGNTTVQTYQWSDGSTTQDLRRISDGQYCVKITDINGCTLDTCLTVTAPQLLAANITTRSPSCFNLKDGSIELKITNQNGLPPQYKWNTGEISKDLSMIGAGKYVATVSDADGCFLITDTITIINPEPILIEAERITPVQCTGERSGSLEIAVSGGLKPYQYNWSSGDQTEDLFDMPRGNYRLVVLDKNRCAVESTVFTIAEPNPLQVNYRIVQDEICQLRGREVDSLILQVEGGRPAYRFKWSDGSATQSLTKVSSGDYSVTVTDQSDCKITLPSIKVQPPQNGFIVTTQKNNISCFNANDGSILARVVGGTAPYLYHLSRGSILNRPTDSLLFSQLNPGSYNLTVTDQNGCTTVASNIFIAQPSPFDIQLTNGEVQNIKCAGESNGNIRLEVNGGTRPLDFQWVNSRGEIISREEDLFNVGADTYTFLIRDANGCPSTPRNFTIKSPAFPIGFANVEVEDVACYGDSTGSIQLRVTGGVAPYQFNWNEGLYRTKDLNNLPAGNYQLQVIDENGCEKISENFVVEQSDLPIRLKDSLVQHISCFGEEDGAISVTLNGGFPPYSLFWESIDVENPYINGDTPIVEKLSSGNYKLSVLDGLACQEEFFFSIVAPSELKVSVSAQPERLNEANGEVTALVSGGTAPYRYSWSLPNAPNSPMLENLPAGFYTVTVEDANGCKQSATIEVQKDTPDGVWEVLDIGKIIVSPNPASNYLMIDFDLQQPVNAKVNIFSTLGQKIQYFEWTHVLHQNYQFDISHYGSGNYWLIIELENVGKKTFGIIKE